MYKINKEVVKKVDKILEEELNRIDKELSSKDEIRENLIKITREIIRDSSNCVSKIHLGKLDEVREIIDKLYSKVDELKKLVCGYPDLYYSGTTYNALAEYVECLSLYQVLTGEGIPTLSELNIPIPPYLQGLGDLVGELRRIVLELLRNNMVEKALVLLEAMETIYYKLRSLHYPDALTPGLRHKVDVVRRLIEDTKALVIDIADRRKLEQLLRESIEKQEKTL